MSSINELRPLRPLSFAHKQVKEIADALSIKPATVQAYMGRIYVRNNVEDRLQLVLKIFGVAWQLKLSPNNVTSSQR